MSERRLPGAEPAARGAESPAGELARAPQQLAAALPAQVRCLAAPAQVAPTREGHHAKPSSGGQAHRSPRVLRSRHLSLDPAAGRVRQRKTIGNWTRVLLAPSAIKLKKFPRKMPIHDQTRRHLTRNVCSPGRGSLLMVLQLPLQSERKRRANFPLLSKKQQRGTGRWLRQHVALMSGRKEGLFKSEGDRSGHLSTWWSQAVATTRWKRL